MKALLEDPTGDLANILLYHVVGAKALSTDLSDGQKIETLLGKNIEVKIMEDNVYINDAMVTVANIETDNGVLHVIDAVLIPESVNTSINSRNGAGNNLDLKVYPMPASSYLNIDFQNTDGQSDIRIFDLTGKVIYQKSIDYSNGITQIDIQNLDTGIYVLNVTNSNRSVSKKL